MARTGKITLYEGTGKTSGKPFKALKLEIAPNLSKLYFLESRMEMDYAINWLEGSDDLNLDEADEQPKGKKGLFNN